MKKLTFIFVLLNIFTFSLLAQEEKEREKELEDSVDVTSPEYLYESDSLDVQDASMIKMSEGRIYMFDPAIVQPFRLDLLVQKHIAINELDPYIDGYRVQIATSSESAPVYDMRDQYVYENREDEKVTYVRYIKPYYRLRVGNYIGVYARWQAKVKANSLKEKYPTAFAVREEFSHEELDKKGF